MRRRRGDGFQIQIPEYTDRGIVYLLQYYSFLWASVGSITYSFLPSPMPSLGSRPRWTMPSPSSLSIRRSMSIELLLLFPGMVFPGCEEDCWVIVSMAFLFQIENVWLFRVRWRVDWGRLWFIGRSFGPEGWDWGWNWG